MSKSKPTKVKESGEVTASPASAPADQASDVTVSEPVSEKTEEVVQNSGPLAEALQEVVGDLPVISSKEKPLPVVPPATVQRLMDVLPGKPEPVKGAPLPKQAKAPETLAEVMQALPASPTMQMILGRR